MGATSYDVVGFIWGLGGFTEFTGTATQSLSKASSDKLVGEVQNSVGQKIAHRSDDQLDVINLSTKIASSGFTRWAVAAVVTINGGPLAGEYRITNIAENHVNNNFADYSITAEKDEYIDLTP